MLYCQKVADRWGRRVGGGELGEPSAGKTETRARAQLRDRRISPNSRRLRLTELKLSSLHLKYPLFPWNSQPGCSCSRVTRGSSEGWRDAKLTIITRKDGHNLAHLGRKCLQLPGALDQHFPEFPITALWERKCLGLHGVPGLHFPECPRTTSTAPPHRGGSAWEYSELLRLVSQNAEGERCPRSCLPGAKVLAVVGRAWTTLPTVP